jgi:hypothetical protein
MLVSTDGRNPLQEALCARRVTKKDYLSPLRRPAAEDIHSSGVPFVEATCGTLRITRNPKSPKLKQLRHLKKIHAEGNYNKPAQDCPQ